MNCRSNSNLTNSLPLSLPDCSPLHHHAPNFHSEHIHCPGTSYDRARNDDSRSARGGVESERCDSGTLQQLYGMLQGSHVIPLPLELCLYSRSAANSAWLFTLVVGQRCLIIGNHFHQSFPSSLEHTFYCNLTIISQQCLQPTRLRTSSTSRGS